MKEKIKQLWEKGYSLPQIEQKLGVIIIFTNINYGNLNNIIQQGQFIVQMDYSPAQTI